VKEGEDEEKIHHSSIGFGFVSIRGFVPTDRFHVFMGIDERAGLDSRSIGV